MKGKAEKQLQQPLLRKKENTTEMAVMDLQN